MSKERVIGGHIYGKDLNEIRFVFDSLVGEDPTPIELGEILVIQDRASGEKYLIRVTNIGYGQSTEWSKEVARGHNRFRNQAEFQDEHEDPFNMYQMDMQDQLYLEATCELLGYINREGTFLTPKRLPSYFSYVRKLKTEDFDSGDEEKSLKKKLGDIPFGRLRSGSEVLDIGAGLFKELLPKHIGVFAQTGGGKSNTMQVLIGNIMELKGEAGMLLFEPHGEYIQNLKKHPLSDQLIMYSKDEKNGAKKLHIPYTEITVDALMNLREQMNWSEPQDRFMREAESVLGKDWFRVVLDTPFDQEEAHEQGIFVPQTLDEIFRIKKGNPLENTIKAVKSKLQSIKRASFLTTNANQNDVSNIMAKLDEGKVVLIDMSSLSGLHEILLSSILSAELLKRRKKAYSNNPETFKELPPVSIVLEEAQRVLGRTTSQASVFAQVCNEGRKFGVGLIAITQQPKLMSEVLISQFNTLVILSISDSKDFDILSSISKKPIDKLKTEIRSLMPGEALISNPLSPFAVPIKVHKWEDYLDEASKKHKKKKSPLGKSSSFGII